MKENLRLKSNKSIILYDPYIYKFFLLIDPFLLNS